MEQEITAKAANALLQAKNAVLLDVREKEEIDFAKLPHDFWITMMELKQRSSELPKNKKIIVACRTGSRSGGAAAFLRQEGFDAVNMKGGSFAWHDEVDSKVRKYVYFYNGGPLKVKGI